MIEVVMFCLGIFVGWVISSLCMEKSSTQYITWNHAYIESNGKSYPVLERDGNMLLINDEERTLTLDDPVNCYLTCMDRTIGSYKAFNDGTARITVWEERK